MRTYIYPRHLTRMLIECEFTNAASHGRERLVFLTDMELLIDNSNGLFCLDWNAAWTNKLRRAMHDPRFQIHFNADSRYLMCVRRVDMWTVSWFIGVEPLDCSSLRLLQRACRRWVMRTRLRRFPVVAAARRLLKDRLNGDVVMLIVRSALLAERVDRCRSFRWVQKTRGAQ